MPSALSQLFVYGTLMRGGHYFPRIVRYVHRDQRAWVHGRLVSMGWYPALVPGEGIVLGVLMDVEEPGLAMADEIESYDPQRTSGRNEFIRRRTTVHLDAVSGEHADLATSREAWIYEYARPHLLTGKPGLIVDHRDGVPVYEWKNAR